MFATMMRMLTPRGAARREPHPARRASSARPNVAPSARPQVKPGAPSTHSPKRERPRAESRPLTVADRRRMAAQPPSFTEMLPWAYFDPLDTVFSHVDAQTLGVLMEITPLATEARSEEFLQDMRRKVQAALQSTDEYKSPWIMQFFVNDDRDLEPQKKQFADYILNAYPKDPKRSKAIFESEYTQDFLRELNHHLDLVSRPQGLFTDTQVSGQIWRGQVRRVRCFIYRKFPEGEPVTPRTQLESAAGAVKASLEQAGVGVRRCNGKDFYDWMVPFFNRDPSWAGTAEDLINKVPYPGDGGNSASGPPLMLDLADLVTFSQPMSDAKAGVWEFDGVSVKALVLQNLTRQPMVGHLTAERTQGEKTYARFDRLPPNSMLSITVVVEPQYDVRRHVERIRDKSRARTPDAEVAHVEAERVLKHMADGDRLVPMVMTLYVAGRSREELSKAMAAVNAELSPSGLRFIDPKHDLTPLDAFIRGLPMAFDPTFDAKALRRSRYVFCSQIASLLPLYGRARGTGHPGFFFWNRGGEPLLIDPLNKHDRKKNGHMLVLGPTGAGKSATLNYLCMLVLAIYRPRLVIVDAGNSFGLLVKDAKEKGLTTHRVELTSEGNVSLPPFVHAAKLLQDPDVMESFHAVEQGAETSRVFDTLSVDPIAVTAKEVTERVLIPEGGASADADDADEADEKRDLLGEMMIAAIMMITGGEDREIERLTRADRFLISCAIIRAALNAKNAGKPHPLTQDVAIELMKMHTDASMSSARRERAEEMGQAMMEFTKALRGKLFNRPGSDWPEVDVTLIELGTLMKPGYEDAMALAYTSIVDSVQSRGEKHQYEGRPLVFLTDEGHLITTNPLLGPKLATGTKMWRKLHIWLWLATQNMKDFPNSMSRVLSMCEWWLLLTMDKSEIEEVSRFRSLTTEQRAMLESAVKEPPKYTEGVILSSIGQMLFRNVPPALPIALAMTESHEKADRRRLMDKHGCTELQAARMVARELEKARI